MLLRILPVLAVLSTVASAEAQPLRLILPTSNDGLLRGAFEDFFQFTDRNFRGVRSTPWEGGQYGFVRNQVDTEAGIVFTRFHEGVDIKPVYRDRSAEPLDTVRAIDDGTVVYVNPNERRSSYGKYVVVEHIWSGMPFYSLYAHLGSTRVRTGDRVRQGATLGMLGYTGRGIDRRRAHVHFEINMMLNASFGRWHDAYFRGNNLHGLYNGMNLAGLDVAALYIALQKDPRLTIERFLRSQPVFFRVQVPNDGALDIHFRYPWLSAGGYDPGAPSLEISLAQSGLPLRIESSSDEVFEPTVVWAQPANVDYSYLTARLITGRYAPVLANSGRRYVHLLSTDAREPVDGLTLVGRVLPPKAASIPIAPATARPAVQVTAANEAPKVRRGGVAEPEENTQPAEDAESAGGEVRGW